MDLVEARLSLFAQNRAVFFFNVKIPCDISRYVARLVLLLLLAHSMLSVVLGKVIDLRDTRWISEICFSILGLSVRIVKHAVA